MGRGRPGFGQRRRQAKCYRSSGRPPSGGEREEGEKTYFGIMSTLPPARKGGCNIRFLKGPYSTGSDCESEAAGQSDSHTRKIGKRNKSRRVALFKENSACRAFRESTTRESREERRRARGRRFLFPCDCGHSATCGGD